MALCRTGALILKATRSTFCNPVFVLPSSVNLQKRHAARKGFREKVKKQKHLEKLNAVAAKTEIKLKKNYKNINKTIELKKPEPPNDDVFIRRFYNYIKYSLPEAIQFHKEYHHPTVFNNPSAPVSLKIEISMIGKKETQLIKPFSGIAPIPHPFTLAAKREVLVFCKPEDTEFAFKCGASMAGGENLIKKVKEGSVQPTLYEYVIAHTSMMPELNAIRSILKLQHPKAKTGTATNDLKGAINKFLHGIEYSCVNVRKIPDLGIIDLDIGTLDMEISQLEENFKAIIKNIEEHRPTKERKFINWIWCASRPSHEQFSIDLSQYIESEKLARTPTSRASSRKEEEEDDDDDDDDEGADDDEEQVVQKN